MKHMAFRFIIAQRYVYLLIGLLCGLNVFAQDFSYEYLGQTLDYTIISNEDKTCQLKAGTSKSAGNNVSGPLDIPETVTYNGVEYTVVSVGGYCFSGCEGLTSVTIPPSITSIEGFAFYKCTGLTTINIPSTVTSMGVMAFGGCNKITSVYAEDLISWCNIDFDIDSNPLGNGAYLYVNGEMVINLSLPEGITTLREFTFENCRSLINVEFPSTLISIGLATFSDCYGLSNINFSKCKSLKSIGQGAFSNCESLLNIDLTNCESLVSLGKSVFGHCTKLQTIDLSRCRNLQSIPDEMLEWCENIEAINLSNLHNLVGIGNSAFKYCKNLNIIDLSGCDNLINIDANAFENCHNIKEVRIKKIEDWLNIKFGGIVGTNPLSAWVSNYPQLIVNGECLEHLEIPESITAINEYAFKDYKRLKSVKFNSALTSIGDYSFNGCCSIENLYFDNCVNLEYIGSYAFEDLDDSLKFIDLSSCLNLKSIDHCAFSGCNKVRLAILPSNLKKIGASAFTGDKDLNYVICNATVPPVCGSSAFSGTQLIKDGTLFVPGEYLILYKNSEGWDKVYNIEPLENFVETESVYFSESSVYLEERDNVQLNLYPSPENSFMIWDAYWESLNTDIARVGNFGKVTAVSPGETTIRVRYGQSTAECKVVVGVKCRYLSLNHNSVKLNPGDSICLSIREIYPDGVDLKGVTWESSNSNIASVDSTGMVKAIASGNVDITARCGDGYDTCKIIVNTPIYSIDLDKQSVELNIGESITLIPSIYPDDANDKSLIWTTQAPEVASVDEEGKVKAIGEGVTIIRVSAASNPEVYAECHVVVKPNPIAVEKVVLSQEEWLANIGDEIDLVATVLPEDATDKTLTWSSSNSDIVSIDENGHAKAIDAGETWICVSSASNPDIYAECHVTVKDPIVATEIIWDQEFHCAVGESVELTGYSSDGGHILYESKVPNGGFRKADIYEEDGKYIVSFPSEGAYILTANIADKFVEKRFNVVLTHEGLMQIDGIYYRFTDDQGSSLKVVRGYDMYSGDYVIPAKANGIPVRSIDDEAFYSCMELNDVEVQEGILSFGEQSFGNGTLHSISIPSTVKSLTDNYIFNALRGDLQSISLHGNIPPEADETTFNGFVDYEKCVVHIPEGSLSLYRKAPIWENFKHLVDDLTRIIAVEKVVLLQDEWLPNIGDEIDLVATVLPENATDKTLTWSSSDSNIVSVDENGYAEAVADGDAWIRVSAASNPEIFAECHVVVKPNQVAVEKVVLSQEEWLANIGDEVDLVATVLPEDATDKTLTWSSSDSNIVSVDENGHTKAIAAGEAWIRVCSASNADVYAECHVVVNPNTVAVEKVVLSQEEWLANIGEEIDIVVTILPEDATDKTLTWTSSDSNIVSVDENGHTKAIAAGEAWIRVCSASNADVYAECHVVVNPNTVAVEKVVLSQEEWLANIGEEIDIVVTILPEDATDKTLTWSSSDSNIVSVDENGHTKAVAAGEAWIRICSASNADVYAECHVVVKPNPVAVEEVVLSQEEWLANIGEEIDIVATILPEDATDKTLIWTSSDSEIVIVDEEGHVKAVAAGEGWIRVYAASNPEIYAECHVVIYPNTIAVEKVVLSHEEWLPNIGDEIDLVATVLPEDATDKTLTWSSSDTDIVSVDENGHAKAVAAGEGWIRICSASNADVYAECHVVVKPNPVAVEEVVLSQEEWLAHIGEEIDIVATILPEDSTDKTLIWTSSDSEIVIVDEEGHVNAVAAGEGWIRVYAASNPEIYAECHVVVYPNTIAVEKVVLSHEEWLPNIGDEIDIVAKILPEDATDNTLTWSSSDYNIVSVDENGYAKAVADGDAWIRVSAASNPEIFAECHVVVNPNPIAVEKVVLSQDEWLPNIGDEIDLVATVLPENATDKTLTWSSSDSNIVSVDENGHAKAIAAGEAWIRVCSASNADVYAECHVVVKPNPVAVEKVVLFQEEWLANIGDEISLVATVLPEDATDKTLIWTSSDSNIVSVDENGYAKAITAGEALIRVCAASKSEVYAECRVSVNLPVVAPEIIWDQEFHCATGESVELTGYSSDGRSIQYESRVPDGGFQQAYIYEEDGKTIVLFPIEGAYILTAKIADKSVEKRFNVVPSHEGLMQIDGLYYRFSNNEGSSLKVVRGYDMYSGDYVIPSKANGIPVTSIDDRAFYSCMELNDVKVKEGILSFGDQSFGNSSLHSISIPSTIKSLTHKYIFNALKGDLQSISLHGNIPPEADETTFNGFVDYEECVVHIPEGSLSMYRNAPIWENFKHLVDDIPYDEFGISVSISGGNRTIVVGESLDLDALVLPTEYAKEVSWASSDSEIVSVDQAGVITGISPGTATIYASVGEFYASITVRVDYDNGITTIKDNDKLRLSIVGSDVILCELSQNSVISIIRMDGTIIQKIVAPSSEMRIGIDTPGIYIIQVDNKIFKIMI